MKKIQRFPDISPSCDFTALAVRWVNDILSPVEGSKSKISGDIRVGKDEIEGGGYNIYKVTMSYLHMGIFCTWILRANNSVILH